MPYQQRHPAAQKCLPAAALCSHRVVSSASRMAASCRILVSRGAEMAARCRRSVSNAALRLRNDCHSADNSAGNDFAGNSITLSEHITVLTFPIVGILLSTKRMSLTKGFASLQSNCAAAQNSSSKMGTLMAAAFSPLPCFLTHRSHSSDTTVCLAALLHVRSWEQVM